MASTIKIKNSSTAGAIPTSSDLVQGELAVNVTDKTIFTENASGTVVELGKNYTGFKNRIINGAMVIDQRNAGASVATSSGSTAHTVDRFPVNYSQTSKFTVQQANASNPAGFPLALGITSSSAYSVTSTDAFYLQQKIEGYNVADLAWGSASAATVTLSFWVRSSLTGTFGGSIANSAFNRSYPFSYTISAANTWEQKTITVAGDTSGTWLTTTGIGMYVIWSLGAGSTVSGSAGSWTGSGLVSVTGATSVVGTNGATFYITGVQLEKGSTATSFDYRPYGTELALCQRYYETGFVVDYQHGNNSAATSTNIPITFLVSKRAAPSVTYASTTLANISSIQAQNISTNGFGFRMNAGNGAIAVTTTVTASIEL